VTDYVTFTELSTHMNGLRYEAIGVLRAMAKMHPERMTDYALTLVRNYDHADAILWEENEFEAAK
jgi:hypothetical protein